MTESILVAVSPFYNGRGWTDSATGIDFEPKASLYPKRISKEKDLSGIRNSIRLNNLLLLEGKLDLSEKEVSIENINPEELTKEQFNQLAKRLKNTGAVSEVSQADFDKMLADKKTLEKELEQVKAELAFLKTEPVEDVTSELEEANPTKEELEKLTVAKLKQLLDDQSIAYGKENKDGLIALLLK